MRRFIALSAVAVCLLFLPKKAAADHCGAGILRLGENRPVRSWLAERENSGERFSRVRERAADRRERLARLRPKNWWAE